MPLNLERERHLGAKEVMDVKAHPIPDLVSLGDASRAVGVSPERIRQLCDGGALQHVRDSAGRRLIPRAALERLLRERERRQIEKKR